MPYKEPEIVRTEVIVVDVAHTNDYGDLMVTDKGGGAHKIGNKRPHLFDQFIPGRAVELGYATYMNKEYIATAKLVELGDTPEKPPEPILAQEAVKLGAKAIGSTDDTKLRSMACAYSKDLACASKIELKDISKYADKFLNYILSITTE